MRDDLIRRSDVYKAVDDWLDGRVSNLNIKDIPSADKPQGEWINLYCGEVWVEQYCSQCGVVIEDEPMNYNFCPNCGAYMKRSSE